MNSLEISADQFRQLADRITELAANYLQSLDSRPVAPATTGEESERLFESVLPEQGLGERALDDLSAVIDSSITALRSSSARSPRPCSGSTDSKRRSDSSPVVAGATGR